MPNFQVNVYHAGQLVSQLVFDHPVSLGRQDLKLDDPSPINLHERSDETRLIVARSTRKGIPRRWFRLSCNEDARIEIENLHSDYDVVLQGGSSVPAGQTARFDGGVWIDLGFEIEVRVESITDDDRAQSDQYRHLESIPPPPGSDVSIDSSMSLRHLPDTSSAATVELLKVALQVVQKAAGSDAFFQTAVDATAQIVGLDRAMVLMRADAAGAEEIAMSCTLANGWCTVAESLAAGIDSVRCPAVSSSILSRVNGKEKTTVIHDPIQPDHSLRNAQSLRGVHCVVASPLLNISGELIGVLYGDRWTQQGNDDQSRISDLEATLVEVLAGAVAGGVARKSEERRRGNLSGFFSPRVADLLASSPDLMVGQDANISVLFCDIRGFSTVTEKLGPPKTIEWIHDVLSDLSQCVVDTDGVLVDYVGDELMAMWGAPGDQPDHAKRAVESAIAMLNAIETLGERWADVLPQRFGAGVGVNTGPAIVGNVGSRLKFKYGVLGNTVNVGSRLQAATKQLQVDCMVSHQTCLQAGCIDQARRLAKLNVVGIEEPIDVYQVVPRLDTDWKTLVEDYETALRDFESERFGAATRRLGELIESYPEDRPCRQLLARAATQLNDPATEFSPVWKLSKK